MIPTTKRSLGSIFVVLLWATWALAGTTGKIAGKVIDRETGLPLPGANVIIVGTTMGAATNLDGEYFILNVQPGTYEIRASIIGYTNLIEKGVRAFADLTTTVNFSLPSETLQLGEVVEVVADRPLIQKDITASVKVSTDEQIQSLPITTVNDAVALNAGAQGSGNNLHIRGGRAGETAYLVDGVSVEDPQTRTIGLTVGRSALSELQIISGGFNAEYGNAQSGVILLNTQEGKKDQYNGHVFYQTDHLGDTQMGESAQNFDWYEGSIGGPEPITTYVLPSIGLKIPGYMTLYAQGETRMSDRANYHENAITDINAKSPLKETTQINTSTFLRNETIFHSLLGIGDNRENVFQNWDTKLLWQLAPNKKLTFGYRGNANNTQGWTFQFGRDVRELVAKSHELGISDLIDQDGDGQRDEEQMNGIDDDNDGRIDEDNVLDQNYYRGDFAWGLDNDGDGRSDEEALNAIDDDGDGRVDEDLQGYDWKGYDNIARTEFRANQLNLNWTHTLNARTFYEVKVGRFYTFTGTLPKLGKDGRSRSSFDELDAWVRDYDAIVATGVPLADLPFLIEPYRGFGTPAEVFQDANGNRNYDRGEQFEDFNGNGLYDLNNDPAAKNSNQVWQLQGSSHPFRGQNINGVYRFNDRAAFDKRSSLNYSLKLDLTSQVTQNHQIKSGLEANYFELRNSSRQLLGPYDGRGLFGNSYSVFPNWQAGYIQDKMEFSTAIVNLGMRVERFDTGEQVATPDTSVGVPRYTTPNVKWSVLPRVGFSFPVTERDMFYFSYGHFYQRPQLTDVYTQVNQLLDSPNSIIGNPDLDPEQTIQYEFGIRHQFGLNTLFSITGFFKDIDNLIQIRQEFDTAGNTFYTYFNDTYGTVKGLELQMNQRAGRYFSGDATYTFQVAKATHSDPRDTYATLDVIDGVEFPSDWDQRHRFVVNLDYHYGDGQGPRLGNFNLLENFNVNVLAQFGSGQPYTPSSLSNAAMLEQTNTQRYPWTYLVDLRARRFFDLTSGTRAGLIFEVQNLLNRRNAIGPDDGGSVDTHRDFIGFTNAGTSRSRNYGGYNNSVPIPNAWNNGRIVRLGLNFEF
ncbi:MAG: TonB-dependent receptor domain-containing protein [bacterium]